MRRHHLKLLEPHAGIDALDPQLQQPQEVRDFPGWSRRAHRHDLLSAIYAHSRQAERTCANALRLQQHDEIAQEVTHDLFDRLGRADRLQ